MPLAGLRTAAHTAVPPLAAAALRAAILRAATLVKRSDMVVHTQLRGFVSGPLSSGHREDYLTLVHTMVCKSRFSTSPGSSGKCGHMGALHTSKSPVGPQHTTRAAALVHDLTHCIRMLEQGRLCHTYGRFGFAFGFAVSVDRPGVCMARACGGVRRRPDRRQKARLSCRSGSGA